MFAIGVDSSNREFFLVHQDYDSNKSHIGKTIVSKIDGEVIIPITRRINKPDGSFGGVVYVSFKVDYFNSFYIL